MPARKVLVGAVLFASGLACVVLVIFGDLFPHNNVGALLVTVLAVSGNLLMFFGLYVMLRGRVKGESFYMNRPWLKIVQS